MYSIWLKRTAKWAEQQGKLLLVLPMIKKEQNSYTKIFQFGQRLSHLLQK